MLKKIFRPLYRGLHYFLFETSGINPLMTHVHNNRKVTKGFIGDEHLQNPTLDDALENELRNAGIEVSRFNIDNDAYKRYLTMADYPVEYYGGTPGENNFTEKTLEHFTATMFIPFGPHMTYVDIAACTSPFGDIAKKMFGIHNMYRQDLIYPQGIHGNKIGGYAHQTGLPYNSVDAITLHCSLEHFEDNTDILFFEEVDRILKPGGKAVILPFYIAHTYTIHVDPAFNMLRNHHPVIDEEAHLRYCNWYQHHSRHYDVTQVRKRIIARMPQCKVRLHRTMNFLQIWNQSYLRWVLEIEKTTP